MAHGVTVCVPVDAPRTELLAHARRVQYLTSEMTASTSEENVVSLTGEEDTSQLSARPHVSTKKLAIITVGVMLSQAVDLHGGDPETDDIYWDGERGIAVVRSRADWIRTTILGDVPRYDPGPVLPCPVTGPRGGACRARSTETSRIVTNPVTGEWRQAWVCEQHRHAVQIVDASAPRPRANTGGLLARAFADYDIDALYAWVCPWYEPGDYDPREELAQHTPRPKLRVIK